jgi:hypothetical protein
MRALRKLIPGAKGTKKLLDQYQDQLFCVRYRYDGEKRKRYTTVELIVAEASWAPPEKPQWVGLRVERQEVELQRRIKQAGGKWNPTQRLWEIKYESAHALGLKARMVKLAGANIGHPPVTNTSNQ